MIVDVNRSALLSLVLGVWIGGTLFMWTVATQNFALVKEILAAPGAELTQVSGDLSADDLRLRTLFVNLDGIGVATNIRISFKQADIVFLIERVSGTQPRYPTANNGDFHCELPCLASSMTWAGTGLILFTRPTCDINHNAK